MVLSWMFWFQQIEYPEGAREARAWKSGASAHNSRLAAWNSYTAFMARGWESKSVEAQQEDLAATETSGKPRLTREEAARLRERENLRLSLQSILDQLERNPNARRRAMLEVARSDLEKRMENIRASRSDHQTG